MQEEPVKNKTDQFPIVGIGASAGGLEAIEQFLVNIPPDSGMAFVVIQHLDPTQKGMLPELLQRSSAMKVVQVKDRMVVKKNCIYVIPPNASMSILKGVLHLFKPAETRGLRLPIDFFLKSLAADQYEHSIGVILSGMGSDGSEGIRDIREKNGLVLVQEPATAKFDAMPRNAIEAVAPDIVAPPAKLPLLLIELLKNFPELSLTVDSVVKDKSSLEKIIILLRTKTGNDFSLYKRNTLYRRIERRMGVHKIDKIANYVGFLQKNPEELDILFKELLIGVTGFFRDKKVWDLLKDSVLPEMLSEKPEGSVIRAWIPGCSTGEEAYSLAIVFKEVVEKVSPRGGYSLQIFATDLDYEAIETARKGVFSEKIAADVSPERLNRYFTKTENSFRINTEIRELVVFANHNLIMHPPFTRIDIISCRNLLIYMDSSLQKKLFDLFYYSVNQDGILILGSAETLGMQSNLFTSVDSKMKIFKRSISTIVPDLNDFPTSFSRTRKVESGNKITEQPKLNIQNLADQLLLQQFSPAGVLVNENGDIIYISGRTGKYLEPAVGKANMNIFAMLREGISEEFSGAFRKALVKKDTVSLNNLRVGTGAGSQALNLTIKYIDKPDSLHGSLMVVFNDIADLPGTHVSGKHPKKKMGDAEISKISELEKELQLAREEMQSTIEEMQTSQEELKSTNEELQSTNEELQSTNEELTTSKEEMQSMNEELQTLNAELQSKVEDFSRVDNDMKNLLDSTDIATLFLDKDLNIRRYTNQTTKLFKLIKSDIGRQFTDLGNCLQYPSMSDDVNEVLKTLVFVQKQVPTDDNRWFSIRIMPYRTYDDRIDGVVITFINLSDLKHPEQKTTEKEK